jgi:FkbH-like protein
MSDVDGRPVLERFHRQSVLTAARPRRADVTALVVDDPVRWAGSVAVWRNHAIEPLQPVLDPYCRTAGLDLDLVLGGYDDSLAVSPHPAADLHLVWFDLDRVSLGDDELLEWFTGRVERVATAAAGPVVVVPMSDRPVRTAAVVERLQGIPGVRCADPWPVCAEAGVPLVDERTAALSGSRVSREAQVHLARWLGTRWLPAAVLPSCKMVAVDLDETLHRGVLGEDGVEGVVVTPSHARLHEHLKQLAAGGVLLALVSRNEPEDVAALFAERAGDYGLGLEDFVAVEVSWGSKAEAVRRAAAAARIGEDTVVFVDDNAGELLTVGIGCPEVQLVHADVDADRTVDALRWQAGLWRWSGDEAAAVRATDLTANADRERLLEEAEDFDRYLEELGVRVAISVDREDDVARLADLSGKTNQFNLNVSRLSDVDLSRAIRDPHCNVASVALADRLSESGVIALLVARHENRRLTVSELAMSCRAMGRGLESILISQTLQALPCWEHVQEVCFLVSVTDRNLPARRWVAEVAAVDPETVKAGAVVVRSDAIDSVVVPKSVEIVVLGSPVHPG